MGIAAAMNMSMATPLQSSTHVIQDDVAGRVMQYMPPTTKKPAALTEAEVRESGKLLMNYVIQPDDSISALACVF